MKPLRHVPLVLAVSCLLSGGLAQATEETAADHGIELPDGVAAVLKDRKSKKDRKSNRLHRNIPSPRGPVKSQRKPLLSSGGSLCGRNRPARGWRDGFSGGRWVCFRKAGNGGASSPGGLLYQDTR